MVRVLVTGGAGFIGSTLVSELVKRDYEVWSFDRYKPTYGLPRSVPTVWGDITYYHSVQQAMETVQPDAVIHLAAISTADPYSFDNWDEVININLIGAVNVAEAAQRTLGKKLVKFLAASSSEVYGQQEKFPLTEDVVPHPNTPYACTKFGLEVFLRFMYETYGFPVVILRPFNTIGTMPRRTVVERTVRQMLKGGPVSLGNPEPIRDFLWISDHVSGYIECLEKRNNDILGETINLCTGRGVSIRKMAEIAREVTGYSGEIEWHTRPKRLRDISCLIGSNQKAKKLLNWSPMMTLEAGIKEMVKTWEQL